MDRLKTLDSSCAPKSINIKWREDLIAEGSDTSTMYHVSVVKIMYKQRPSYFYVIKDKHIYSYLFGNNWKEHLKKHEDVSAIWQYIQRLDNTGWLCLNDLFDQVYNEYEQASSEYKYFEDFYLNTQVEDKQIVLKFIEKLQKNLEIMYDDYHHWESDRELILQAILHIYVTDKEFFLHNIQIEKDSFEKIISSLKPSLAVSTYNKDLLETLLQHKVLERNKVIKV